MDEVTKETSGEVAERQLTDKELEAILKQSEGRRISRRFLSMNSKFRLMRNGWRRVMRF